MPLKVAQFRLVWIAVLMSSVSKADTGDVLQSFANPDPGAFALFGYSVAVLTGEELVVSAPGAKRDSWSEGAVYILNTSTGEVRLRLRRPEPQDACLFGQALAIDDRRLIVGDPRLAVRTDRDMNQVGAVHVFDAADGSLVRTISNPDPKGGDHFGWALKVWTGGLLISALGESRNQGIVHLFDRSTLELVRSFVAPSDTGTGFGRAIDADGALLVIGAPREDGGDGSITNSGIAFVYDSRSGSLVSTLRNPAPAENDGFGSMIAIAINGLVIVGAEASRKAHVFDLRSGELRRTLDAPTAVRGFYGSLIGVHERQAFVGSSFGWVDVLDSPLGSIRASFEAPESRKLPTDFASSVSLFARGSLIVIGNPGVRHDFEGGGFARDSGAVYLVEGLSLGPSEIFLRGDANADGRVNIADSIWLIQQLFRGGPAATCNDAADANDDGQLDISDALYVLSYQLFAGSPPPEPFKNCGEDPTAEDHLVCNSYSQCLRTDIADSGTEP